MAASLAAMSSGASNRSALRADMPPVGSHRFSDGVVEFWVPHPRYCEGGGRTIWVMYGDGLGGMAKRSAAMRCPGRTCPP